MFLSFFQRDAVKIHAQMTIHGNDTEQNGIFTFPNGEFRGKSQVFPAIARKNRNGKQLSFPIRKNQFDRLFPASHVPQTRGVKGDFTISVLLFVPFQFQPGNDFVRIHPDFHCFRTDSGNHTWFRNNTLSGNSEAEYAGFRVEIGE